LKKQLKTIILSSLVTLCTSVAVFGSSLTTEIKAILSKEVNVKYQGEIQVMKDGAGNVVYPIMYNGTTYLPIRAVSNMLDIPVNWDASTKTVILGTEKLEPKSVLKFESKTSEYSSKVTDKVSLTVEGELGASTTFNDGISFRVWNGFASASIDRAYQAKIGGKYSKLSFVAYVPEDGNSYFMRVYNVDTKEQIACIEVKSGEFKQVEEIDITGVNTLGFAADCTKGDGTANAYFFNPVVE